MKLLSEIVLGIAIVSYLVWYFFGRRELYPAQTNDYAKRDSYPSIKLSPGEIRRRELVIRHMTNNASMGQVGQLATICNISIVEMLATLKGMQKSRHVLFEEHLGRSTGLEVTLDLSTVRIFLLPDGQRWLTEHASDEEGTELVQA